jgi:flagellar biosynthesis protein FliR
VPAEVKIGVGVTLGLVIFPALADRLELIPVTPLPYLTLLLKELFIGLSLAFVVAMVFQAAQIAGTLMDTMAGTSMAQVMVPQIQQQVSLFSSLKMQLAIVLFLTLNGHHLVITSLADSLVTIPIDQMPRFGAGLWPFFELVMRVLRDLVRIGLSIAAPVFVAVFLTDLSLGMINRVAPQVQVFFISMQIKPMVTVLVVMVSMSLIVQRLLVEYRTMLKLMREALRLLG